MNTIEIDMDKIVEDLNIKDIIINKITEDSGIDDLVNDIFSDDDLNKPIKNQIVNIISEYLNTDDGKDVILAKFNDYINEVDISDFDEIDNIIKEFIKNSLILKVKK